MLLKECKDNILVAIKNPPKMVMQIKNYHYETSASVTDAKGKK